jgi:hypothetical protein
LATTTLKSTPDPQLVLRFADQKPIPGVNKIDLHYSKDPSTKPLVLDAPTLTVEAEIEAYDALMGNGWSEVQKRLIHGNEHFLVDTPYGPDTIQRWTMVATDMQVLTQDAFPVLRFTAKSLGAPQVIDPLVGSGATLAGKPGKPAKPGKPPPGFTPDMAQYLATQTATAIIGVLLDQPLDLEALQQAGEVKPGSFAAKLKAQQQTTRFALDRIKELESQIASLTEAFSELEKHMDKQSTTLDLHNATLAIQQTKQEQQTHALNEQSKKLTELKTKHNQGQTITYTEINSLKSKLDSHGISLAQHKKELSQRLAGEQSLHKGLQGMMKFLDKHIGPWIMEQTKKKKANVTVPETPSHYLDEAPPLVTVTPAQFDPATVAQLKAQLKDMPSLLIPAPPAAPEAPVPEEKPTLRRVVKLLIGLTQTVLTLRKDYIEFRHTVRAKLSGVNSGPITWTASPFPAPGEKDFAHTELWGLANNLIQPEPSVVPETPPLVPLPKPNFLKFAKGD